jgi:hypothetical protein
MAKPRRFPFVITIGVTDEIMTALQDGTRGGLFTISDSARLALYTGLQVNGLIAPQHYRQNPPQPNGNGASHAASG